MDVMTGTDDFEGGETEVLAVDRTEVGEMVEVVVAITIQIFEEDAEVVPGKTMNRMMTVLLKTSN